MFQILRSSVNEPELIASADRHHIVAAKRKIVKSGGVAVPARHVHRIATNDMRCGAHLNPALARGTLEQRHFKFDGRAWGNHPGS